MDAVTTECRVEPDTRFHPTYDERVIMHKLAHLDALTVRRTADVCLIDLTDPGVWERLERAFAFIGFSMDHLEPGFYVVKDSDRITEVEIARVKGDVGALVERAASVIRGIDLLDMVEGRR